MNRYAHRCVKVVALLAFALGTLALTGCMYSGMSEGAMQMKAWGYVVGQTSAQLDVADQPDVGTLVVKRMLVPTDAWIVVNLDATGTTGAQVGLMHIPQGDNLDIQVPLSGGLTTDTVVVAVYADKGTPGKFDFNAKKKTASSDRPLFVNGQELAKHVVLGSGTKTVLGESTGATTTVAAAPAAGPAAGPAAATGGTTMGGSGMTMPAYYGTPAWDVVGWFAVLNAGIIAWAASRKRRNAKAVSEGG